MPLSFFKDLKMTPIEDKSTLDLIKSLLAEAAKARNELNCAEGDLAKAKNRLSFILMLINEVIKREN